MKPHTRIDYAQRIERVAAMLADADLDGEMPSVETLAGVAAMSPFHFHRVFRLMTGETVGELIRRLRLSRSITALAEPGTRVTDASGAAGYASSQAYARAIRTVAGMTASEARADAETLSEVARQLSVASNGMPAPLAIEIVTTPPLRLRVLRNVGDYAELKRGYERLFERVFSQVPMTALRGVHGLFDDDPQTVPAADFRFSCAVEIDAQQHVAIQAIDLAPSTCLRVRHVGDYASLLDAVDGVTATALAAGLSLGDDPLRAHYIDTPDDAPPDALRTDLYLQIAAG